MALTSTIHHFDIDLADGDRRVYETLALRVARHPSESEDYLLTRVLAYALEYRGGDRILARALGPRGTGDFNPRRYRHPPCVGRHRVSGRRPAAQGIEGVATGRGVHAQGSDAYLARLNGARIHRPHDIELWAVDRGVLSALVAQLDRRVTFSLAVTERELFVAIGSTTITGALTRHVLG